MNTKQLFIVVIRNVIVAKTSSLTLSSSLSLSTTSSSLLIVIIVIVTTEWCQELICFFFFFLHSLSLSHFFCIFMILSLFAEPITVVFPHLPHVYHVISTHVSRQKTSRKSTRQTSVLNDVQQTENY